MLPKNTHSCLTVEVWMPPMATTQIACKIEESWRKKTHAGDTQRDI